MKNLTPRILQSLLLERSQNTLKKKISSLLGKLSTQKNGAESLYRENELRQILEARTRERSRYYIQRLLKGLTVQKSGKWNDLNLNRWKIYDDILTDSLWILDKRDRSGNHSADYWGNFIPQIPNQLLRRYTKKGDWVLDPFLGSGTTMIECKRLGLNSLGIELQPSVARKTKIRVSKEPNPFHVSAKVIAADSTQYDYSSLLSAVGCTSVQFALLHPPYWNIIRFSKKKNDLSNSGSLRGFLDGFGQVVQRCSTILDQHRYLAVVIGDKYVDREWIPLGFYTMQETLRHGFMLKSIIVKNYNQTKAKRAQEELWRYRALVGGFYIFKHEYIFLFQKS